MSKKATAITSNLRALLAAATPGPWHAVGPEAACRPGSDSRGWYGEGFTVSPESGCPGWETDGGIDYYGLSATNAALIAAAINALPRLLDVAEAARVPTACWEHASHCCEEWCRSCQDSRAAATSLRAALDALEGGEP